MRVLREFFQELNKKFDNGALIEVYDNEVTVSTYSTAHFVGEDKKGEEEVFQEHLLCRSYYCDLDDSEGFQQMLHQMDVDINELNDRDWGILIGEKDG
jgi:5-deoxy-D-glucuronate isomerase